MILLGDLEANQLAIDGDLKVWCIVLKDYDSKEVYKYPPDKLVAALYHIEAASKVIFHNYIGYDMRVLQYKYPKLQLPDFDDTLIMSRLFDPDRRLHSIEAYGIECGVAKPVHEDWSQYTDEMLHRCAQDVHILDYVYTKMLREYNSGKWDEALQLEYGVAIAHNKQVARGVRIDVDKARGLLRHLDKELLQLDGDIQDQLPLRCVPGSEVNRIFKKDGSLYANVQKYFSIPEA